MISRLWVTPGEYSMKARSQSRQGSSSLGDDSSNAIFSRKIIFQVLLCLYESLKS